MASGKQHQKVFLFAAPFVVGGSLVVSPSWCGVSVALGYLLGGAFGDPDLDVDGTTIAESRLRDSVPIFGWLFTAFWMPYALLAKHRGGSHTPILGTLGRAVYIVVTTTTCVLVVGGLGSAIAILGGTYSGPLCLAWSLRLILVLSRWILARRCLVGFFLVGWGIADMLHILFDWFPGLVPILPGERREGGVSPPSKQRRRRE